MCLQYKNHVRHRTLFNSKKVICEQLKNVLFCFHAHFMLIYQEKCINIIVNKSIITSYFPVLSLCFLIIHNVCYGMSSGFNGSLIMNKVIYIMSSTSINKLMTLTLNWLTKSSSKIIFRFSQLMVFHSLKEHFLFQKMLFYSVWMFIILRENQSAVMRNRLLLYISIVV